MRATRPTIHRRPAASEDVRYDTQNPLEVSWVITTEVNRFIWPGPDIRAVPGGAMAYGHLPAALTQDVVKQIKTNARDQVLMVIGRDDAVLNETIRQSKKSKKDNKKK